MSRLRNAEKVLVEKLQFDVPENPTEENPVFVTNVDEALRAAVEEMFKPNIQLYAKIKMALEEELNLFAYQRQPFTGRLGNDEVRGIAGVIVEEALKP